MNATTTSSTYGCPHCGLGLGSKTARWRHVSACNKNPNPACPWCGLHYAQSELDRHASRCAYRNDNGDAPETSTTAPAVEERTSAATTARASPRPTTTEATAKEARHADAATLATTRAKPATTEPEWGSDEDDDGVTGIYPPPEDHPREQETRARARPSKAARCKLLLATPAKAPPNPPVFLPLDPTLRALATSANGTTTPQAPPTPAPSPPDPEPWRRIMDRATVNMSMGEKAMMEAHSARLDTGAKALLGTALEATAPRPSETRDPWAVIIVALVVLAVVLLFLKLREERKEENAQERAQAALPAPKYRPPMDVSLYPTAEAYLAAWGHLPPPPPGHHEPTAPGVGLARR